jgi:rhomboid protease GluP
VITVYRFIPSHLFCNDPDTANDIGFDQQPSLPFFSSEFSLETLARLFSSIFIHVGVFIFHGISLCCSVFGVFAKKSIGILRHIFNLISGIAGALLHGILASYVLGNGGIILIGRSGAISTILGIATSA